MLVKNYNRIGPALFEKWTKAKLNLIKYPTIEKYLNNFFYTNENEKINHPLINLLYYNSEVLNYLNQGLELISNTSNNSKTTEKLINRLINKFQCNSAIQEIVTIWYFYYRLGKDNVRIEEITKDYKLPDILVNLPTKKIIFEITALNQSRPFEKITKISEKIAKYVSQLHTEDYNFLIRIGLDNTQFIVNRKKQIEIEKSVNFFCKYIVKLNLQLLFKDNMHLIFPVTKKKYTSIRPNEGLNHSLKSKRIKIENIDRVDKNWLLIMLIRNLSK